MVAWQVQAALKLQLQLPRVQALLVVGSQHKSIISVSYPFATLSPVTRTQVATEMITRVENRFSQSSLSCDSKGVGREWGTLGGSAARVFGPERTA